MGLDELTLPSPAPLIQTPHQHAGSNLFAPSNGFSFLHGSNRLPEAPNVQRARLADDDRRRILQAERDEMELNEAILRSQQPSHNQPPNSGSQSRQGGALPAMDSDADMTRFANALGRALNLHNPLPTFATQIGSLLSNQYDITSHVRIFTGSVKSNFLVWQAQWIQAEKTLDSLGKSDSEKLVAFKSCLGGEAASMVNALPCVPGAFLKAKTVPRSATM